MPSREHLSPTDVICIVSLVLLAALYALTRENDLKTTLMGLILFTAGRISKRNGALAKVD